MNQIINQLKRHEGFRGQPYTDTTGHTTIGYGRNLDARPLTEEEGAWLLERDLLPIQQELLRAFPLVETLDPVRHGALLNMAYNLGIGGLKKFRRFWWALASRNWPLCADEALDSRWARQVGSRAHDIAYMLRTGEWPDADQ